jgi:hypothetical protein
MPHFLIAGVLKYQYCPSRKEVLTDTELVELVEPVECVNARWRECIKGKSIINPWSRGVVTWGTLLTSGNNFSLGLGSLGLVSRWGFSCEKESLGGQTCLLTFAWRASIWFFEQARKAQNVRKR